MCVCVCVCVCACAAPDVVSGGSSASHVSVEMSRFYSVCLDLSSKKVNNLTL